MRRAPVIVVIAALAAGAAGCGADDAAAPPAAAAGQRPPAPPGADEIERGAPAPAVQVRPGATGAQLLRRTQLRERPGGRVIRALGKKTNWGSARVLAVVAQRGRWLGVLTQYRANSREAWIPADAATLLRQPYSMTADLSRRELVVRRKGGVVRRVEVAIGRAGSETPTGRFAVTDALRLTGSGSPYGCCALALTGRQPRVPQGWSGGDRLAVHGTTSAASLGTPASAGCLRASDRDMRWLLKRIPLGAILRIRR